jgi:L-serine dehydratase
VKSISIFNEVIGPVMLGPSSSHTAGAFQIEILARSLLGAEPARADIIFDPEGSYGKVYKEQGADRAFVAGLLGWSICDGRVPKALEAATAQGKNIRFHVRRLVEPNHPNTLEVHLTAAEGRRLSLTAKSVGGGAIEITHLNIWEVRLTGHTHVVAVEMDQGEEDAILTLIQDPTLAQDLVCHTKQGMTFICVPRRSPLSPESEDKLRSMPGIREVWSAKPVFFVHQEAPIFSNATEMVNLAEDRGISLGEIALEYEARLLGMSEKDVMDEMTRRFEVMRSSVFRGLEKNIPPMQLLAPSAGSILTAEAKGRVAVGGTHTRAAARAMAVMHVSSGMGVICAAPTAGSAGVIPAVATTLLEEKGHSKERVVKAILAAGAIGIITARRATFAAEIAGCQVEIGAAGAMAAALVVDAAGGSPKQAADAAAIVYQNNMGSVCDLVQGIVEIPCHTRNAQAASSAFVCADLIMGGYENPIPLDDTIDAVFAVGKSIPKTLKVTSLGGLAQTPSALCMKRRCSTEG